MTRGGPVLTYAIVCQATAAVCRVLHEAPLRMLGGGRCEARAYVAEVLTRAFPETPVRAVVRWCGSRDVDRDARLIGWLMSNGHWRPEVVAVGLAAIGRPDLVEADPVMAPLAAAAAAPPMHSPSPAPPAPPPAPLGPWHPAMTPERRSDKPNPYRRVVVHEVCGVVPMGEPGPGRSALDERRAREALGERS